MTLRPRVVLVMFLTACTQAPTSTPSQLTLDTHGSTDVLPFDHPPITATGGGSGAGGGSATGGGTADGGLPPLMQMGTRRLNVMQLQASLPIVLGGNTWQINSANGFVARSSTLGVANYISVTQDAMEPSPLYLKFMADAARDGCNRALNADLAIPTDGGTNDAGVAAGQETLYRFADANDTVASQPAHIDANLRYLKLRFHGVKVAPTDDTPIAQYRALFVDAYNAAKGDGGVVDKVAVKEGWRAVCVALLTAPEYHLY